MGLDFRMLLELVTYVSIWILYPLTSLFLTDTGIQHKYYTTNEVCLFYVDKFNVICSEGLPYRFSHRLKLVSSPFPSHPWSFHPLTLDLLTKSMAILRTSTSNQSFISKFLTLITVISLCLAVFAFVLQWKGEVDLSRYLTAPVHERTDTLTFSGSKARDCIESFRSDSSHLTPAFYGGDDRDIHPKVTIAYSFILLLFYNFLWLFLIGWNIVIMESERELEIVITLVNSLLIAIC